MAIAGAAISAISGTAAAAISMRRVSASEIVIAGGDSSSTGSSVQAGIDHSEVMSVPLASAATTGNSSGAQNAAAASRRSAAAGQIISASVARPGRPATNAMITGTAT